MTPDEARRLIIEGINRAAYHETDSLHDADKNRLFGSKHYKSGRLIVRPGPWAEGDFEEKMSTLLRWANILNRSVPAFKEAQTLLEDENSVIGHVIRRSKRPEWLSCGHGDGLLKLAICRVLTVPTCRAA
jgi:hypothetical protein